MPAPRAAALAVFESASAAARLARAEAWLAARPPAEPILVVAPTRDAGSELLRRVAAARGAAFGWHRATPERIAYALAEPILLDRNLVPIGRLAAQAVCARAVHNLAEKGGLGRYTRAAEAPGFARAVAAAIAEARLAAIPRDVLAAGAPELAALEAAYAAELDASGLADRARIFELAAQSARDPACANPLLGLPTLLFDTAIETHAERELANALLSRAPVCLATLPRGDARTAAALEALAIPTQAADGGIAGDAPLVSSLEQLQAHLFEAGAPETGRADTSVTILSAPGESRECVEIARRLLTLAREGVPFDRMAILLRSPDEYRPHLTEALGRARIPVHFARGVVQPDPAGRAFLALLACAAEGLSAGRFAEYMSLGEVPDASETGAPPAPKAPGERWVAPDEELVPEVVAAALESDTAQHDAADAPRPEDSDPPVRAGTLRAPRHWERLLVDAAVIGGRARWERRLDGLAEQLRLDLEEIDDADGAVADRTRRDLAGLARLRAYALPLLDTLAALPRRAHWGAWLDALSALATQSLRHPARVLAALAELAPMTDAGPVELAEVRLVLSRRLLEAAVPPEPRRYGAVYVAPAEAARGLCFDVVCVPGLAERLFPRKIAEEPILLDEVRAALSPALPVSADRIASERLALRIAVGAASTRLILTYPRLDLDQGRPRVPSFYALEALRAAEGELPGFDTLAARAERVSAARVGWPAPENPHDAIDEAEHDLALLDSLLTGPEGGAGTARYLLDANAHLGRALRFRARRWIPAWTQADGLVAPPRGELAEGAREAIAGHQLGARSYSPTALQHFSSCPYRFLLQAVHRLAPRETPEAIDEMDALTRGSMVHDVQFELFGALSERGLLPVRPENLDRARTHLDACLDRVADEYRERLAPAIERVWQDGVASVRADLREWLRRAAEDTSGLVPAHFELSFGLPGRRKRDPDSVEGDVPLDCGIRLRGSIDLIEREGARVRVTDHKTGRDRVKPGSVIGGGTSLQPVLYALVAEKLFPDSGVESGRLYYCTAAGGFRDVTVPLDAPAREGAEAVARTIDAALAEPFLPAAPAKDACRWCDYATVCGPYEDLRTGLKWRGHARIEELERLRERP